MGADPRLLLANPLIALAILKQGVSIGPDDEQELRGRAIKHAGFIEAVRDLVLELPIDFTGVRIDVLAAGGGGAGAVG